MGRWLVSFGIFVFNKICENTCSKNLSPKECFCQFLKFFQVFLLFLEKSESQVNTVLLLSTILK